MSFDRNIVRQAAAELAEEKLEAERLQVKIDLENCKHAVVYQVGMACVRREFPTEGAP